jgi:hypothetical protein
MCGFIMSHTGEPEIVLTPSLHRPAADKDQQDHQIPDRMISHSRASLYALGPHAYILTASGRQSNQIYPTQAGGVCRTVGDCTDIDVRYWQILLQKSLAEIVER